LLDVFLTPPACAASNKMKHSLLFCFECPFSQNFYPRWSFDFSSGCLSWSSTFFLVDWKRREMQRVKKKKKRKEKKKES